MAKTEKLQALTDKEVKEAFVKYCEDQERSESKCLDIIVKRVLKAEGYLK